MQTNLENNPNPERNPAGQLALEQVPVGLKALRYQNLRETLQVEELDFPLEYLGLDFLGPCGYHPLVHRPTVNYS